MKKILKNYWNSVDKKLIYRQRIFLAIISVLIIISAVNVGEKKIGIVLAASGFLIAALIGLALSRMFNIFWHEEKEKVVSQLDKVGSLLLGLYILIEIGRNWLFGYWLSGAALTAFGLIVLTGLLLGRFLGTHLKIRGILAEGKISSE
jgi:hypothetical protein